MKKKEFYNYYVYEDGRVYSLYCNRFLKGQITKLGYKICVLYVEGEPKPILAHRLVATLWLDNSDNFGVVNHIDGNKLNNHYSNLEWCTLAHNNKHARDTGLNNIRLSNSKRWENVEFRTKTSASIAKTRIERGTAKGRNNPRFRYIVTKDGEEVSRQKVVEITGLSQSRVDTLIRKASQGVVHKLFEEHNIRVKDTKEGQSTIESIT